MDDIDRLDDLDQQVSALGESLGGAVGMAAAFTDEMTKVRDAFAGTGRDIAALEREFGGGLRQAIRDTVVHGKSLSDALRTLAGSMIDAAFNSAVEPVSEHFGGLLAQGIGGLIGGLLPFEKGGSFSQGRVRPFASGGIVSGPVAFPMRGGETGLMGEAGPEAVMPLERGADGRLGVLAQGGGTVNVVMNIQTPDAESFRRSRGQIAAQLGRVIGRGNRNR